MAKKDRKGKYLTLKNVRVYYDEDMESIRLISKDKDLRHSIFSRINIPLNDSRNSAIYRQGAELALWELLFKNGMMETKEPFDLPAKYNGVLVAPESDWDQIPLGINRVGKTVFWDATSQSKMLLSAATGGGKTVITANIINHCLKHPDRWKLSLIDPLRVEFYPINDHPNVEIVTEHAQTFKMISDIYEEMVRRFEMMETQGVDNFKDLDEQLPAHLLVIDEARWILKATGSKTPEGKETDALIQKTLDLVTKILASGNTAGICLILSSYSIDNDLIDESIRNLFNVRIHVGRASEKASFMALGNYKAAATNGSVRGRGYMQSDSKSGEVQFFWASLRGNT